LPEEIKPSDSPALPENPTQSELVKALAAETSAAADLAKANAAPAADPEPITPEIKAEPVVAEEPKTDPPAEKTAESAPGTESTEPIEPVEDEELPPEAEVPLTRGAKKRIAIEVGRQNAIQRQIDEAVSKTKSLKADLAKITTTDTPGPEPAPTTEPVAAKTPKPVRPVLNDYPGTFEEWQAASDKHDVDLEAWYASENSKTVADLTKTVTQTVEKQLTAREQERQSKQAWDDAIVEHGAEFPAHMDTLRANSPEGLQIAISGLDNWTGVASHLGKNPEELKSLTTLFERNPFAAVASLGKLEARLDQAANQPPKEDPPKPKPLPDPPPKVGGGATANVGIDLNKEDPGSPAWKREARRQLALKADS
jgi:hypothetical protein